MKLRSVIWTYILLSILYLGNLNIDANENSNETISAQEKKAAIIDSVFERLSFNDRIKLLSINKLTNELNDSSFFNKNGFLSNLTDSNQITHKINVNINAFEKIQLRIAHSNSNLSPITNLSIGQSNEAKLAKYNAAIITENLKKKGYNILLGSFFQTYNSKLRNEKVAYTSSPLGSEKYWQALLEGAEENGLKVGISDPFLLDIAVDSLDEKDFQAIGLAGNRYYSRKGHGLIQLNNDRLEFRNGINPKGKNTQVFLREDFRFNGVIISPDYSSFPVNEQAQLGVKSIERGTDLVCVSFEAQKELDSLMGIYFEHKEAALKERCKRILGLKFDLFANQTKITSLHDYKKPFRYQALQAALTCVKNELNILPIKNLNQSTYFFTSGENISFFSKQLNHYTAATPIEIEVAKLNGICVVDGFNDNLPVAINWAKKQKNDLKLILVTSQTGASKYRTSLLEVFDAILLTGDASELSQQIGLQALFGAYQVKGKLPFYLGPKFPMGHGLELEDLSRLSYVSAEYVGISEEKMNEIDQIVESGISAKAFPGCQVLVGFEGKIIYEKAFGDQDYSQKIKIDQQTIYDIASITKIAASTSSLMKLESDHLFSLDKTLGDYIPEIVGNTEFAAIQLREMMAHQAGLPSWIPFYVKTLSGGKPNPFYYSKTRTEDYSVPVANNLWIKNNYPDTIYDRILSCELKSKSYVYSDLGYYFVKKIIEKLSNKKMEEYVQDSIYSKLGLQTMTYNPYLKFNLDRIAPTEKDNSFRDQLIKGYVHDPGAAMMGGVGGHAGIFSTANDLAILMQMMLNGGYYGGKQILKKSVISEYTSVQFPASNRRGAGFDKPNLNGTEATACALASPVSYGHSGFTGTLTWADPKNKINYVFLSNRVYPNAENWKIVKMDIRTKIQTKIYQAIESKKNFDFLK